MKKSDTLTRILESSTELFVQHGYRGLSMRELAAAVGVSKPALYYHFNDKESLFLAVLDYHLQAFGKLVDEAKTEQGAKARLERFLKSFFALPVSTRRVITLNIQERAHLSPENRKAFGKSYADVFVQPLEGIILEGLRNEEIRPVDPATTIRMFLGLVFPFVASPSPQGKELAQTILDTFWHGIGKEAPS